MLWVEFSISTVALVQVRYGLFPSQTQEVEVGHRAPVTQRAKNTAQGIIETMAQRPESHFICGY